MINKSLKGKKRISIEEYNKLPEEEKRKWNFQFLDEQYSPGPGDDCDVTYRVVKAGKKVIVAPFWVDHHRTCEQFNDSSELCQKGARTFRRIHFEN